MSLLFIADLHLSPDRPAVTDAFYAFLTQEAEKSHALYILGDLFDVWIGDDDPSAFAAEVQERLKAITAAGTSVYIQRGNRDFLLSRRFMVRTGATLLGDRHVVNHGGRRLLVMHGDLLCTDDIAYQRFRRKTGNPIYRWLLRHLPLIKRQNLARDWRGRSEQANRNKSSAIMDVNSDTVRDVMEAEDVAILIHGHTHRPARHALDGALKERIVLGDWHSKGWALRADSGRLDLFSFDILSASG